MGSNTSNLAHLIAISADWKFVAKNYNHSNLLQHSQQGLADEYLIPYDPHLNITHELQMYYYRKLQSHSIVRVIGVDIHESQTTFCGGQRTSRVLTQHIPIRLAQITTLTLAQAIYVLLEAFKGYKEIHKRIGVNEITAEMIGITSEGFVKVWINQHFAYNHASPEKLRVEDAIVYELDQSPAKIEERIVTKIYKLVLQHLQSGKYPYNFPDQATNFANAQAVVYTYASTHNLFIPDRINQTSLKLDLESRKTSITIPKHTKTSSIISLRPPIPENAVKTSSKPLQLTKVESIPNVTVIRPNPNIILTSQLASHMKHPSSFSPKPISDHKVTYSTFSPVMSPAMSPAMSPINKLSPKAKRESIKVVSTNNYSLEYDSTPLSFGNYTQDSYRFEE